MMQARCADCEGDSTLTFYCDVHFWLRVLRQRVIDGSVTDWTPELCGCQRSHAATMTSDAIAYGRQRRLKARDTDATTSASVYPYAHLMAELAVLFTILGVTFDTSETDTPADWQAAHGNVIAPWVLRRWVEIVQEREKGQAA